MNDCKSTTQRFEELIDCGYENRNRDLLGIVTNLQCEASEVAELIVKKQWYSKEYTTEQLLS